MSGGGEGSGTACAVQQPTNASSNMLPAGGPPPSPPPPTRVAHHRRLAQARGAALFRDDGLLVGANHNLAGARGWQAAALAVLGRRSSGPWDCLLQVHSRRLTVCQITLPLQAPNCQHTHLHRQLAAVCVVQHAALERQRLAQRGAVALQQGWLRGVVRQWGPACAAHGQCRQSVCLPSSLYTVERWAALAPPLGTPPAPSAASRRAACRSTH